MSFAWSDFLALAEALERHPAIPGPEEAVLRTAISRAYYSAFCSAREFAVTRDGLTIRRTGDDHNLVAAHFRFAPEQARRRIAFNLKRLRDFRNRADYDTALVGTPKALAQTSVALARNVLTALSALQ